MRRFLLLAIVLSFVTVTRAADAFSLAIVPSRSSSKEMRIEIGGANARPFYAVLTNHSKESQQVFETWNSWGFYNVEFEATLSDGKKLRIKRGANSWGENWPSTYLIPPGERYVMTFLGPPDAWSLDSKWPKEGEYDATLKGIYKGNKERPAMKKNVWMGPLESPEYKVKLVFGAENQVVPEKPRASAETPHGPAKAPSKPETKS